MKFEFAFTFADLLLFSLNLNSEERAKSMKKKRSIENVHPNIFYRNNVFP